MKHHMQPGIKLACLIAAITVLSGCAQHTPLIPTIIGNPTAAQQPSKTAPITFAHPPSTDSPDAPAPTNSRPQPDQSGQLSAPPSAPPPKTAAAVSLPSGHTLITSPAYTLATIDRKSPEQAAWAYLTLRMAYSYTDIGPTQHSQQAATFATPQPPATTDATQTSNWAKVVSNHIQAAVTITEMDIDPPGPANHSTAAQTLIRATWTRNLTSELAAPIRSSGATTVTVQLQHNGTWLVSDSGFSAPN